MTTVATFVRDLQCASQILTKHELPQRILEKILNINFHENPSSGIRVFPCEHAGRLVDGEILRS
jgi:hypothetical protein